MYRNRFRVCLAVIPVVLHCSNSVADDPELRQPTTISGLRQLAMRNAEVNQCTEGQQPHHCWICAGDMCGHTESLAFGGWAISSRLFVSRDVEALSCNVSAQAIRIAINYLADPPKITFQVPGRKQIIFHEARPVHLFVDSEQFTNPSDGPYREMAFENEDGSLADKHEILDKMQSAYRIAVEGWNVNDEKISTVDLGEGLANAMRHCHNFAASAFEDME